VRPAPVPAGDVHARHLYSVLVDPASGWERDALVAHLGQAGITTSVHFRALHLHPYYRERYRLERGMFPNAERVSDQVISLPLGGGMPDDEAWRVVEALRRAIPVRTR
jgi:dTDP-4-amino-4,6-dideoxygalactose transaminase